MIAPSPPPACPTCGRTDGFHDEWAVPALPPRPAEDTLEKQMLRAEIEEHRDDCNALTDLLRHAVERTQRGKACPRERGQGPCKACSDIEWVLEGKGIGWSAPDESEDL